MHAARVGSAWQVELWEPPASIPVYTMLSDLVEMTRICDRLAVSSKHVRALEFYRYLAESAASLVRSNTNWLRLASDMEEVLEARGPRSFNGWGALVGFVARAYNEHAEHEKARSLCKATLQLLNEADRAYVTIYLQLEIQLALAEAGLGHFDEALAQLDALIERYGKHEHPLVNGSLYEARAQVAWAAGLPESYEHALAKMEQWYRPTGTPALIAKCERLSELATGPKSRDRALGEIASARKQHSESRRAGEPITTGRLAQKAPASPPENDASPKEVSTVAEPRITRRKS
jgi:hypothetical protein